MITGLEPAGGGFPRRTETGAELMRNSERNSDLTRVRWGASLPGAAGSASVARNRGLCGDLQWRGAVLVQRYSGVSW